MEITFVSRNFSAADVVGIEQAAPIKEIGPAASTMEMVDIEAVGQVGADRAGPLGAAPELRQPLVDAPAEGESGHKKMMEAVAMLLTALLALMKMASKQINKTTATELALADAQASSKRTEGKMALGFAASQAAVGLLGAGTGGLIKFKGLNQQHATLKNVAPARAAQQQALENATHLSHHGLVSRARSEVSAADLQMQLSTIAGAHAQVRGDLYKAGGDALAVTLGGAGHNATAIQQAEQREDDAQSQVAGRSSQAASASRTDDYEKMSVLLQQQAQQWANENSVMEHIAQASRV